MKFFFPGTASKATAEQAYAASFDEVKAQLRWPMAPRRIYALTYVHDRKTLSIRVGDLDRQENRYLVLAIFESSQYVAFTRTPDGDAGVMILIGKDEVTAVEDFA